MSRAGTGMIAAALALAACAPGPAREEQDAALRIDPDGGFVHEHHLRIMNQTDGKIEAPLHSAGKVLHRLLGPVGQTDPF